jgi:DNA-binding cell septation regulator SpoVG
MNSESDNKAVRLSEIQIVPVRPRKGLLAFVSFIVNGSFYVADVAVYSGLGQNGYRLVYPMRTLPNGAKVNVFHPIKKDVAQEIERQVSEAYQELLAKVEEAQRRRGEDDGKDEMLSIEGN